MNHDEQIAAEIQGCLTDLNEVLDRAAKAGLHVEVELVDVTDFDHPERAVMLHATIERRTRLS